MKTIFASKNQGTFSISKQDWIRIGKITGWYDKFLEEGDAKKNGVEEKDVDPKELAMGIEIEKEHSDDLNIRKKISLDHLSEDAKYYTHLKEMENKYSDK